MPLSVTSYKCNFCHLSADAGCLYITCWSPRWSFAAGGLATSPYSMLRYMENPALCLHSGTAAPHLSHVDKTGTTTHGFGVFQNGHDHLLAIMHERKAAYAGGQREELRPWRRSWGRRLGIRKGVIKPQETPVPQHIPQNQSLFYALTCTSDFTEGSPP